jgi:hypothetical protein
MRGDTHTVNGLAAYNLGPEQSTTAASVQTNAASVSLSGTRRSNSDVSKGFPYSYPTESPTDMHYTDVDDVTADDGSSYIYTGCSTSYVYDRFGKPSYTLPADKKVAMVRIVARVMTEYQSSTVKQADITFGVEIGGTYYLRSVVKTNNAWATYTYDLVRNPSNNLAWTQASINSARLAVRGRSYNDAGDYQCAYCTQIYMEVYVYSDATVCYAIDVIKRSSGGSETTLFTKVAQYSCPISALYDSPGLKSANASITLQSLASTDAIRIDVYQRVGAGSWISVRTFITEQLGAQNLDNATWTVTYYLDTASTTSQVSTIFYHGTTTYNSYIKNFEYT